MYQQVLPRAARLGGFGEPAWIAKASRKNFRFFLAGASQEYTPEQRPNLIEAFRPWAESTGQLALFERFERGDVLRFPPNLNTLRGIVGRARTALRRPLAQL